jgi:hypothetical protein
MLVIRFQIDYLLLILFALALAPFRCDFFAFETFILAFNYL